MDESLEALQKGSAQYVEQPVVQDGKIITANGPEAAQEFGETIISELSKVKSKRNPGPEGASMQCSALAPLIRTREN